MTLQQHFNLIKEGKGNKDQFLKQARSLFPQYFNQYTDFNTATNVLKSKQIISEAAGGVVSKGYSAYDWKKILGEEVKAMEKETSKEVLDYRKNAYDNVDMKNADNVNFNEIMKGFFAEMYEAKNQGKTGDEIKAMVVKNLAKDPLYYTKNGNFSTMGVGYTEEAPGLGEPKEPKGKFKSSGYGDIEKEVKVKANVKDSLGDSEAKDSMPKKVKEMSVTPQNSAGVKKMKMPGAEKKMKLQEGFKVSQYDNMSDEDIINWAKEDGMEDFIEYNEVGELKREELLSYLLGKEAGSEDLGDFDYDTRDKEAEHDFGPDDTDPAGGYGPSSHMESLAESKIRSVIAKIIQEELKRSNSGAEYIEINGKTVKTYTQNGDKSYSIVYDDGTKDIIPVSNDAWDEINNLHMNSK